MTWPPASPIPGIGPERLAVFEDIGAAAEHLQSAAQGHIYVITCFSDKDKILSLL